MEGSYSRCRLALAVVIVLVLFGLCNTGNLQASQLVPQTWLPGDTLFPTIGFTQPLPIFGPGYNAALPRVDATSHPFLKVSMKEIKQQVLPSYPATSVWAYEISDAITGKLLGPAHWPAVTVETERFIPTWVKYDNDLPSFGYQTANGPAVVQGLVSVDQSLHWADPLRNTGPMKCVAVDCTVPANSASPCCRVFHGPVPAVAHLHGAEAFSGVDGGPEQWFTPTGLKGQDFFSYGKPGPGEAIYVYDNLQEPGTLWFHDHALGATRTNVYSGLATFYFIRGPLTEPQNLPKGAYEVEMAIQDRQFDTKGQLFFPDGSSNANGVGVCGDGTPNDPCLNGPPPNPNFHPFWIPEFFGDVAIVNGAPWPVMQVEPRRYLFRILDGSNARMYRLAFGDSASGEPAPPVYVIGMDDNYLDKPVNVTGKKIVTSGEAWPDGTVLPDELFIAPGERNYVIVDFTGMKPGQKITLINNAPAPFPSGLLPGVDQGQKNINKIMQFQVIALKGKDTSCNPASGGCQRPFPLVRLSNANGGVAAGTKIDKVRQLVLKEHEGPGGPVEVFVNNTRWDGLESPGIASTFPKDGVSELPRVGSTELWEIINLTMDAHPMHTHLTQFQIVNRQDFQGDVSTLTGGYYDAWAAAFPAATSFNPQCTGGVYCPGYGPPLAYNHKNADGAFGGNPPLEHGPVNYLIDPTSGSQFPRVAPDPEESGWKDTAKAYPGQVMRILVRWTPTSIPKALAEPGCNLYTFDPTSGPGYVWHCHIVDHEDNEMMRPYIVTK